MTAMTDEELAARLKRIAPVVIPRGPLLEEAADRLYALSAHVALLKASLAQAERETEKPDASAEPVAWANFAETGNIRIWTSAAKEAVRIAQENGIDLMPLYSADQLRAAVPDEREALEDAESDAGRLALELECLLLSISDMPAVSRWWGSANEALDLHRSRLDAIRARGAKGGE